MKSYSNLVIEGNGVNGLALLGVLSELERNNLLSTITHFAGSSSGGFMATLLALKFSVEHISNFLSVETFKSLKFPCYIRQLYNLVVHNGLMSIDVSRKQFEKLISSRYNVDLTFQQLYEQTGNTLVLTATDLKHQKPIYLNRHSHPDVRIVDAAMASISIPVLYIPRKYDFGEPEGKCYYVDGGLTDNYPLWIFNDEDQLRTENYTALRSVPVSPNTLGLVMYKKRQPPAADSLDSLIPYLKAIFNTLLGRCDSYFVTHSFVKQSIEVYIDTGIFFGDFDITQEQWRMLFDKGEQAAKEFLLETK